METTGIEIGPQNFIVLRGWKSNWPIRASNIRDDKENENSGSRGDSSKEAMLEKKIHFMAPEQCKLQNFIIIYYKYIKTSMQTIKTIFSKRIF